MCQPCKDRILMLFIYTMGLDKLPKNTEMEISRDMGEGGGKKLGSTHQLLIFTLSRAYLSSILLTI